MLKWASKITEESGYTLHFDLLTISYQSCASYPGRSGLTRKCNQLRPIYLRVNGHGHLTGSVLEAKHFQVDNLLNLTWTWSSKGHKIRIYLICLHQTTFYLPLFLQKMYIKETNVNCIYYHMMILDVPNLTKSLVFSINFVTPTWYSMWYCLRGWTLGWCQSHTWQ